MATKTEISLSTVGRLVSTTDMDWARRLQRRVSIRALLHGDLGHYRLDGNSVIIYAFGEMYELELT